MDAVGTHFACVASGHYARCALHGEPGYHHASGGHDAPTKLGELAHARVHEAGLPPEVGAARRVVERQPQQRAVESAVIERSAYTYYSTFFCTSTF